MINLARFSRWMALLIIVLTASSCERIFDKGSKENIAKAEKKAMVGDFPAAAQLYEAALDGTVKSAETHYKLALIYADKLKKPLDAVHHLNRYLELAPNGTRAKDAQALQKTALAQMIVGLNGGSPATQGEMVRLRNENQALLNKLAQKEKAALEIANAKSAPGTKKPIPANARTYTVKAGDTLAKISRLFYKNSTRAADIQAANFYQSSGTAKIKPGMVLIIPKEPGRRSVSEDSASHERDKPASLGSHKKSA